MTDTPAFTSVFLLLCLLAISPAFSQTVSASFEFQFEGKTLRGLIESPQDQESKAIVILIPGYGATDFVEGGWYSNLRNELVALGLTVCLWDKMGCGASEGEFNAQQPVGNSAAEALAAIEVIKKQNIPGSEKIGLWGLSRAGWICPLINEKYPVDFWISVSGTDDKENYGYLLKSNLIIAGKAEAEAEELYQAWMLGHRLICTQATFEQYVEAIQPLTQDSTCRRLFGYANEIEITEAGRNEYQALQQLYTSKGTFDEESGLWVYLDDFAGTLQNINCPVLALFGANDAQVDWRKTKALYEETIGGNPNTSLTVKVFDNCNHNLQKCITCGYQEDLSALQWQACDGYYETMAEWLKAHQITE